MIFKLKTILTYFVLLLLGPLGCASIEPTPVIEPVPFDENNSYALNIANQTFLRQDFKWGLETTKSPLKDFSLEEIQHIKTSLENRRSGTVHKVIGVLKLATGDLWGVVDIGAGSLVEFTATNHPSASVHWIVALDASKFDNGIDAKDYANSLIKQAILDTLLSKGNLLQPVVLKEEGKATFGGKIYKETAYSLGEDQKYLFGLYRDYYNDKNGMELGKTNLISAEQQYVTIWNTQHIGIGSMMLFLQDKIIGYKGIDGFEQFVKDVTRKLPDGFFLYVPPLPRSEITTVEHKEDWGCFSCRKSQIYYLYKPYVPALYTKGGKYEFIKNSNN